MKSILIAAFLMGLHTMAWAPFLPPRPTAPKPHQIVLEYAEQYRVPASLALGIWTAEASRRTHPPDGRLGERGAFQVSRGAAKDAGCDWSKAREFRESVRCGLNFLVEAKRRCRSDWRAAAHYYNRGRCPTNGKVWAYAVSAGMPRI